MIFLQTLRSDGIQATNLETKVLFLVPRDVGVRFELRTTTPRKKKNELTHLYIATNKYYRFKICTIKIPVWKQVHTIKLVKKSENKIRTLVRTHK